MLQVYPTSGLWILMLALYHSQMRYHMIKLNKRYVFLCFALRLVQKNANLFISFYLV